MSLRARLKLANLAVVILLLGLTPYPRAFTEAMRQADSHRAAREYGAALAAYQQAANLDPDSPLPWLQMGEVLLSQHRFLPAAVAFREAERLGGDGEALRGLGESYSGRGDWATAMMTWLSALALTPDDARLYLALGRGSIAQGHFDQAAGFLSRALELQSTGDEAAAAHALLGRLQMDEDPAQAADHLRQAGDDDMLAVLDVVNAESASAECSDAESDLARRALLLGAAFLQRNELTLARREFERSIALAPANAEAHAYLAHTLDRLGETVAAGKLLQQALELDPGSALVYYFLGVHYRRLGNVERAQAALWEALRRDPENAALRVEMAEAFVAQGDYPHAEEWYQAAVEAAPDDIEFHLLFVHFYLDHLYRVEEGGLPAAQAAVALAPDDPRTHDLLGWAYHLAGRQVEASQALNQALKLDPDLTSAHYHLGSLYASSGQRNLARQHLQRVVDLDTGGYYRERAEMLLSEMK
jgi:tetratricopeptide (TPR) repeat protein